MRSLLADMAAGLFFFAVLTLTNDIYAATVAGVIIGLGVTGWIWHRSRTFEPMQLLGVALVIVMGGATLLFHDPRFIMYKPTVYFVFAGLVMVKRGWMYRYIPVPPTAHALPQAAARARRRYIEVAGIFYCAVTLAMAAANAVLAGYASQKTWALFNAAAAPVVYSIMGCLLWAGARRVIRRPEQASISYRT